MPHGKQLRITDIPASSHHKGSKPWKGLSNKGGGWQAAPVGRGIESPATSDDKKQTDF